MLCHTDVFNSVVNGHESGGGRRRRRSITLARNTGTQGGGNLIRNAREDTMSPKARISTMACRHEKRLSTCLGLFIVALVTVTKTALIRTCLHLISFQN